MTQADKRPRPPRIAASLVELFASAEQAESILGDLAEEFSDIVSKSGVPSARRWYWRQSVKTISHLGGASFRSVPWSLAGFVLLGFLLRWSTARFPESVTVEILRALSPYHVYPYMDVLTYGEMLVYGTRVADFIVLMLIGCLVAGLAKGREMVATSALTFFSAIPVCLFFLDAGGHFSRFAYSWPFLIIKLVNLMAIVLGGVIVREMRSVLENKLLRT